MGDNSFAYNSRIFIQGNGQFYYNKNRWLVMQSISVIPIIFTNLVDVFLWAWQAGAFSQEKKNNGAGGMGGKITPSAVLVIQNGTTKLVNIKKSGWTYEKCWIWCRTL